MPDTIKISELDEALAIADAAEFPYTQENGGELTTFKAPLTQIAAKVVEDMSYAGIDLPAGAGVKSVENTLNYLLGAVGGNPNANIATEYDPTETYAKGDYVIYENVLYICTDSDGTTGTFDPTAWSQTELAEHTAQNAANIGDLSSLTTTNKDSLVDAVNEVNTKAVTITENSGYTVSRITSGINAKLVGLTAVIDGTYTVNSWVDVGTIDKKPSADALAPFVNPQNGAFSGMVNITSAGAVRVYATSATTRCGFTISYATA